MTPDAERRGSQRHTMDANADARRESAVDTEAGSDLDRLVRLEDRIAGDLARAESEAAAIMDEAARAVRSAEQAQAGLLEQELAALREKMESECRDAIVRLEEGARRQIERFDSASGERLERLASRVVERILATAPAGAWPEDDRRGDDDHQDVQGAHPGAAGQTH